MGEMRGVWPEDRPLELDDEFKEPPRRMSDEEFIRLLRALTPEEWAELEATPGARGRSLGACYRTALRVADAEDLAS
jgi:hypothetical protein